jgi:hypothetical protein
MARITTDYVTGPSAHCCDDVGGCVMDTDGSVYCGGDYSCCPIDLGTDPTKPISYQSAKTGITGAIRQRDPQCTTWSKRKCNQVTFSGNRYSNLFKEREPMYRTTSLYTTPIIKPSTEDYTQWDTYQPTLCGPAPTPSSTFKNCNAGFDVNMGMSMDGRYDTNANANANANKEQFVSGRYRRSNQCGCTNCGQPDYFCGCQTVPLPEIDMNNGALPYMSGDGDGINIYRMYNFARDTQVYPTALTPILKGYRAFGTREPTTKCPMNTLRYTIPPCTHGAFCEQPKYDTRYMCS